MKLFIIEKRIFICETYIETKSPKIVQRQFHQRFPDSRVPGKKAIQVLVKKFRTTGSVQNGNKRHSGRKLTVRVPEQIEDIRQQIENSL